VGGMKISLTDFFELTIEEALILIDGNEKHQEELYSLMFMACYNANGAISGGKKFKLKHPFYRSEKKKKKVTKEQRDETLAFLQKAMQESR
jgi:hypothetical protein